MTSLGLNATLDRYDRELGESLRGQVGARRRLAEVCGLAAGVMSPAYRILVLTLILWRPTRARGLRALAAAVLAASIAKRLRDTIRRPRPGTRPGGGLPSRHAAASVAIAAVLTERRTGLGLPMALITAIGLLGRVATGDHDPGDVIAGVVLGGIVARVMIRITGRRRANAAD
jgi:membrane-associated phospholipid phosphatase